MVRLLVLAVIVILVVIAFRLGRESEHGRLIDLEPDKAESEKWSAKTAASRDTAAQGGTAEPVDATAYASGSHGSAGASAGSGGAAGTARAGANAGSDRRTGSAADDDVIDVLPEDIEEL